LFRLPYSSIFIDQTLEFLIRYLLPGQSCTAFVPEGLFYIWPEQASAQSIDAPSMRGSRSSQSMPSKSSQHPAILRIQLRLLSVHESIAKVHTDEAIGCFSHEYVIWRPLIDIANLVDFTGWRYCGTAKTCHEV
jgi:hypothetical protein